MSLVILLIVPMLFPAPQVCYYVNPPVFYYNGGRKYRSPSYLAYHLKKLKKFNLSISPLNNIFNILSLNLPVCRHKLSLCFTNLDFHMLYTIYSSSFFFRCIATMLPLIPQVILLLL